jgi:hypothetical protein
MRYGLESALPINAFSPRGRGPFAYGMTLEGGGGGFDPFQAVGDALASIDPGPAIGQIGVEIDQGVNSAIPGGWVTVGAIALAATGIYFGPELMSMLGAEGVAASEATFMAADAANLASQGLSQAAIAQNLAAGYSVTEAAAAAAAAAAAETVGTYGAAAVQEALPYTEMFDASNLAKQGLDSSAIAQNLAGSGVDPFLAQDMAQLASQGLSPEAISQALQYSYTSQELAPLGLESLQATPGMNIPETLNTARKAYSAYNQAKNLIGGLTGSQLSGLTMKPGYSMPTTGGLDMSSDTTGSQSPLDLTASITKGNTDFSLTPENAAPTAAAPAAAIPTPTYAPTQYGMAPGTFAAGGSTTKGNSESGNYSDPINASKYDLSANITRGNTNFHLPGYEKVRIFAEGGEVEHNPQFFSEGGLGSLENRYVTGEGNGTSDEVPAMLANGEFVIPADVVSGLGNGSNDSGAKILDEFLETLRSHKQKHDAKHLPPDSKGPLAYLLEAKKRAKA